MYAISLWLIAALSSTQQVLISGKTNCKRKRTLTRFRNSCTRIFSRTHSFFANTSTGGYFFENTSNKGFRNNLKIMYLFEKFIFSKNTIWNHFKISCFMCLWKCSSLVIFSKTQHCSNFFENTQYSVFAKYLANQYSR